MSARRDLLDRLTATKKYRHLCSEILERTADWALLQESSVAKASLLARRKLHQIYGAFWRSGDHRKLRTLLDASLTSSPLASRALGASDAPDAPDAPDESLEPMCRQVLNLHTSTRERFGHLDRCYRDLWAITGSPASVADLACGLSPFALPWMGLSADCPYYPSDIDSLVVTQVNRYLRHVGRDPNARCLDLLSPASLPNVDVCLILKTLSCLDRQEREAAARLLGRVQCRWLVVSMPTHSLGGHKRGMRQHNQQLVGDLLAGREVKELHYPGEVFFVTRRDR